MDDFGIWTAARARVQSVNRSDVLRRQLEIENAEVLLYARRSNDLGMAQIPCSMCQRRTTWAAVLPCFFASATIVGFVSGSLTLLGSANLRMLPPMGDQASVKIPSRAWVSLAALD